MPPRKHFEESAAHIAAIFIETLHVSDRVAAISCASLLDDTLGAAIASRFVALGKDWEDRIFADPAAPLGTFASKITIGYALGLFGPITRANLNLIRSIRNDFAHKAETVSFNDQRIAEKCNKLISVHRPIESDSIPYSLRKSIGTPRNKYIGISQWLALDFSHVRYKRIRTIYPDFLR